MSAAQNGPIRVFLLDDSPLVLVLLKRILRAAPEIEVVGTARDAREALGAFEAARPDVICIAHRPPTLDGVALIGQVMASFPRPILVINALFDPRKPDQMLPLLAAGAVAVVAQPGAAYLPHEAAALVQKIKILRGVMVISRRAAIPFNSSAETHAAKGAIAENRGAAQEIQKVRSGEPETRGAAPILAAPISVANRIAPRDKAGAAQISAPIGSVSDPANFEAPPVLRAYQPHPIRLLAVGASTGGPQVLQQLFAHLPANLGCPVVCVQHISEGFLQGLVDWLNEACRVRVKIAENGETAQSGTVYFPPEARHLEIDEAGHLRYGDAPPLGGHKPAVSVLFESVARAYGRNALGVLLTGMGSDGASGLEAMMLAGGATIAQDAESCVVFGMPKQAIARGAAHFVLNPQQISAKIERLLS